MLQTVNNTANKIVSVLLPLALSEPYDYEVRQDMEVEPGSCVLVPLGGQQIVGVVWGEGSGQVEPRKLKPVLGVLDLPPLPDVLRRFIDWIANYTLAPKGMVLRLCLRNQEIQLPEVRHVAYRLVDNSPSLMKPPPIRMTKARQRLLDVAGDGLLRSLSELAREAGVSESTARGLAKEGILEAVELKPAQSFPSIDFESAGKPLSPAQAEAASVLRQRVREQDFKPILLDGVTGSGKTEVYFEALAQALSLGRQSLILLPEIALTSQFLDRFEARFGARPVEWHSELGQRERANIWRGVALGHVRVVVGARSALFLPFAELGLIIVDEEHEAAFKQEEGVIYHARDMAVVRASLGKFPIVLSSATPSLETIVNAQTGRYEYLHLPDRHGVAELPKITAIDMRRDPPESGRFLAPRLVAELGAGLVAGEQSMLFLNRRGYAPLTLCRTCGHRIQCPQCSAWLVEHKFRRELLCHHCGCSAPVPKACPSCGTADSLVACGPGVERIAEEVAGLFPQARIALLSSDNLQGPKSHEEAFRAIETRNIDIIIGTQIVAKGHHFPWLTLVGVVDGDLGLENGDLRAAERTFQLLQQVSGRAGRAERPGRVFLQTYMPEHPVMRALVSGERDAFLAREAEARERLRLPPFGRLAGIVVSSKHADLAGKWARMLARTAPVAEDVTVLGPAPAPLSLLRGRTRLRLLVKTARNVNLQAYLEAWMAHLKVPSNVRIAVDIDPYSFL